MAEITTYQCPSCTGPLKYSAESGKLECEYCGSVYTPEEIHKQFEARDAAAADKVEAEWGDEGGTPWSDAEAAGLRIYSCPSCGAEVVCDENTAATSCVYCGNPTVVPSQLSGGLKPDLIIPFKHTKEDAVNALKKHYSGKLLLPSEFKKANHIEEVKGVYVPFWLFDCSATGHAKYTATRKRFYTQGKYDVTETSHFIVSRDGSLQFTKIPVDGSTKMPDAHMDAIEPYDYSELIPFSTSYLPGYFADKYDVDSKKSSERANSRVNNSVKDALMETVVGYTTVVPAGCSIDIRQGSVKYALLPVWLLSTKWNGKNYLFAMNGQTGKFIGDLPVSWKKFWMWFAGIWAGVCGITALIQLFM